MRKYVLLNNEQMIFKLKHKYRGIYTYPNKIPNTDCIDVLCKHHGKFTINVEEHYHGAICLACEKLKKVDLSDEILNKFSSGLREFLIKKYIELNSRHNKKSIEKIIDFNLFSRLTLSSCSYCGGSNIDKKLNIVYCGIDRVDSTKGYIIGNVTSCCFKCNMMKGVMTVEEFKAQINKLYQNMIL